MPTVHLAGNRVIIGTRVIQRCLICGDRLTDYDLTRTAVPVGMGPPTGSSWEVGAWVEQDGNRMVVVGQTKTPEFERTEVPDNCCVDLVEM